MPWVYVFFSDECIWNIVTIYACRLNLHCLPRSWWFFLHKACLLVFNTSNVIWYPSIKMSLLCIIFQTFWIFPMCDLIVVWKLYCLQFAWNVFVFMQNIIKFYYIQLIEVSKMCFSIKNTIWWSIFNLLALTVNVPYRANNKKNPIGMCVVSCSNTHFPNPNL